MIAAASKTPLEARSYRSCGDGLSSSGEGEPRLVDLFAMVRDTDLPAHMRERPWVEPPLTIRCADGTVHPEYAAVKLAVGFPP